MTLSCRGTENKLTWRKNTDVEMKIVERMFATKGSTAGWTKVFHKGAMFTSRTDLRIFNVSENAVYKCYLEDDLGKEMIHTYNITVYDGSPSTTQIPLDCPPVESHYALGAILLVSCSVLFGLSMYILLVNGFVPMTRYKAHNKVAIDSV